MRGLIFLAPLGAAVGLSLWLAPNLFVPRGALQIVAWWLILVASSAAAALAVDRLARRLLPLTAMLQMTMVFPDRAPSRFRVALRSSNIPELRRRVAAAERGDTDLTEAAGLIISLANAINDYDRRLRGHSERTRAYADVLAAEMGVPQEGRDRLRWAALLHDVGKIELPLEILNKPGPLDPDEKELVKQHPLLGMRVAAPLVPWLGEWAQTIEHHHEWWDGSGYPRGLRGEQISLGARIVAVADAFDVMTTGRPYQAAKGPEEARREIARMAGKQFDPAVARALMNVSLGRLRWSMGPVAWLGQIPFFLDRLGRDFVTVTSAAAMATVSLLGGLASLPFSPAAAGAMSPQATAEPTGFPTPSAAVDSDGTAVVAMADPASAADAYHDSASTSEGVPVALDVIQNDTPDDLVVEAVVSPPSSGRADLLGPSVILYSPAPGFSGADRFEYRACTPDGSCDIAVVTVRVEGSNRAPVAADDTARTGAETPVVIDILRNDTDPDGDTLRVASIDQPSNGRVVSDRATATYRPAPGFSGDDTFTYRVCDEGGLCADAAVTVSVVPAG
ncbi:MAG TPA: HD domain-containing phosphohydrolase [Acidimicrobiia bacterium]